MRILMLNWKDIKNPKAGGAEVVAHEIGKRWVEAGHKVTMVVSKFPGCAKEERIDGINIVRVGSRLTVYLRAATYYKRNLRDQVDVIIEAKNGGLPWLSYRYAEKPVIGLVHQTGRNFNEFNPKNSTWHYELPPGLGLLAYVVEPLLLRPYRQIPLLVVSNSTRKDFVDLGCSAEKIHVVPEGIAFDPVAEPSAKEYPPAFIYVGRLKKSKRVDHLVKALAIVSQKSPEVRLWIVGKGDRRYEHRILSMVREYKLEDNVTMYGFVSENEKRQLLQRAYALLITSIREGWGLVVTEANAMGTPAIGYDVPGLRDSIIADETGVLVQNGDVGSLAEAMLDFIRSETWRHTLTLNALEFSRNFSWDRAAKVYMETIHRILDGQVS